VHFVLKSGRDCAVLFKLIRRVSLAPAVRSAENKLFPNGCLPDVNNLRRSLLGNGYGCRRRRQRSNTLRNPRSRDVHVPRRPARGRQRRVKRSRLPGNVSPFVQEINEMVRSHWRGVVSALSSIDREQYDAFRFPVVAVDAGTPSRTGSVTKPLAENKISDTGTSPKIPTTHSGILWRFLLVQVRTGKYKYPVFRENFRYRYLLDTSKLHTSVSVSWNRSLKVVQGYKSLSRTGSALVVIEVDDVNDERPTFSQKVYVFRVWENELPGTNVIFGLLTLFCFHPKRAIKPNALTLITPSVLCA